MQPHQQRVVDERAELHAKMERLSGFTLSDTFAGLDRAEQDRLRRQLGWMAGYRAVLDERTAAFKD